MSENMSEKRGGGQYIRSNEETLLNIARWWRKAAIAGVLIASVVTALKT